MTKNLADELQRTARQALSGLHPAPQGEEPGGLPFRKLLASVFRFRYLLFATTMFGLLVGSFLAITTANSYVSTGKFRFTGSGAEVSEIDPSRATQTSQEAIGTTATYILSTEGLLRKVVEKVKPERILAPYLPGGPGQSAVKTFFFAIQRDWNATRTEDVSPEEALKRLQKTLFIERPRFTDVLVATCTANDPKLAQEILSVYMVEAVEWHIAAYEEQRRYEETERAKDEAVQTHDAARRALREFLDRKAGVSNFDDEKKRLLAEEAEASARVTKLSDDLKIAESMIEVRRKQLEGEGAIKPWITVKKRVDKTAEAITGLQQEIAKRVIERADLIARTGKRNDPKVLEIDQAIKILGESITALNTEAKDAPLEEVTEDNPEYLAAKADREKLHFDAERVKAELNLATQIQGAVAGKLKAILGLEAEFEKLNNALQLADATMKSTQITWLAAQQKRALGQGNFSTLKQIEAASLPLEKEGPNRGKLLLGGLLVGLFLGLGLIVLRSLPDTVVRTREDLERVEGLQVIGVLPRLDNRNLKRHRLLRERGW